MNVDDYQERQGNIIIAGPPGVGKTLLASQMPKPIIITADLNVRGPINYIKEHKLNKDVRFWAPNFKDDEKTLVEPVDRWDRMCELGERAFADPNCETVVFDSITTISDYAMDKVRKTNGKKPSTLKAPGAQISQPDWGTFLALFKHFIISSKASPKLSIWIAHIETKKDDLAGFLKVFLSIPTTLKEQIAGLFDEVWLLSTEEETEAGKLVYPRYIRTTPGLRQEALGLKTSRTEIGVKKKIDLANIGKLFEKKP